MRHKELIVNCRTDPGDGMVASILVCNMDIWGRGPGGETPPEPAAETAALHETTVKSAGLQFG